MADNATAKNGVYFDTKAGKVVEKQPEEGIQLVAPGGEITAAVQARIDNYNAAASGDTAVPQTVTTDSGKAKK